MSQSKPDIDAMMVDWLYGELGDQEAASFEQHLADHPADRAEAEALQRTRTAFKELDEEEPRPSLTAMLMKEAALAATPKMTLWSRVAALFQPIVMHPAASAMATVVLLCGVAGALYMRHGSMVAEPTTKSEASRPAVVILEAADTPAPALSLNAGDKAPSMDEDIIGGAFGVGLVDEVAQGKIQEASEGGAKRQAAARAMEESETTLDGSKTAGRDDHKRSDDTEKDSPARDRGFDDDMLASQLKSEPAAQKPTLPQERRAASNTQSNKKQASKDDAWEEQQIADLQQAAKSKRCVEVGRIANDILDKNSSYYRQQVEKSKAAFACQTYIASETNRRAKMRAKTAKARAKATQGESLPKKAKAAPLEAADETANGL